MSTIPHSSVPGNPAVSMSPTSLNTGMNLWNASPAGDEAATMRQNQSSEAVTPPTIMGREVALGEQWIQV